MASVAAQWARTERSHDEVRARVAANARAMEAAQEAAERMASDAAERRRAAAKEASIAAIKEASWYRLNHPENFDDLRMACGCRRLKHWDTPCRHNLVANIFYWHPTLNIWCELEYF